MNFAVSWCWNFLLGRIDSAPSLFPLSTQRTVTNQDSDYSSLAVSTTDNTAASKVGVRLGYSRLQALSCNLMSLIPTGQEESKTRGLKVTFCTVRRQCNILLLEIREHWKAYVIQRLFFYSVFVWLTMRKSDSTGGVLKVWCWINFVCWQSDRADRIRRVNGLERWKTQSGVTNSGGLPMASTAL